MQSLKLYEFHLLTLQSQIVNNLSSKNLVTLVLT